MRWPHQPTTHPQQVGMGWDDLFCAGNRQSFSGSPSIRAQKKGHLPTAAQDQPGLAAAQLLPPRGCGTSSCPLSPRTRSLQDLSCPSPRRQM